MDEQTDEYGDDELDDELEDPLLRMLAAAPAVPLGTATLPPGTLVGQSYRLQRRLGAGAMGVVYEAVDQVLSRRVALKVHEIGRSDRAARMWREARAMARLSHPNVVTVHEVGVDGSRGFIAMELVEGTNARQWCEARPRTWAEILAVYRAAGRGLAAAHAVGLVHRDFKPDNLMIGDDGRVRVADFGLVLERAHGEASYPSEASDVAALDPDDRVTRAGTTVGTPAYMAPEQRRRGVADARSDQFAYCVALHEALFGVRPGAEALAGARRGASDDVPRWIDTVLTRGMATEPDARYPDMHAVVDALDPAPRRRRRVVLSLGLGGTISALALLRVGGMLSPAGAAAPDCAAAGAAIDDSWSDETATQLAARWRADAPALAEVASRTIPPVLDAWRDQWRDAARSACEATRVRGEQSEQRLDERMDCLAGARRRFDAVIDVFGEAKSDALARADTVLATLPDLSACARVDAWGERARLDPERQAAYDDLSRAVDRAVAQVAAGRVAVGRSALDEVIPALESAGFQEPLIEARRRRGEALLSAGRRDDALVDLVAAHDLALLHADRDTIAETMLQLARAVGETPAGTTEAQRWLASARHLVDVLQWSPQRQEPLGLAAAEIAANGEQEAHSLELIDRMLEQDPLDVTTHIRLLSLRGAVLQRSGRFEEALATHDLALAYVERERGPNHPLTADVLGNRTVALDGLSRLDEIERSLARMLEIRVAAFGPDAPLVGDVYLQLAGTAVAAGRMREAASSLTRAEALHRAGGDDIGLVYDLAMIGEVQLALDDVERSRVAYDEAVALAERTYGPNSLRVANVLLERDNLHRASGQPGRSLVELERAQTILSRELAPDDTRLALAQGRLSTVYGELGRHEEAVAHARAAMRTFDARLPPDSPNRVLVLRSFAGVLSAAGEHGEALDRLRAAQRLADRVLPSTHRDRLGIHVDLVNELVANGSRDEAIAAARAAIAMMPGVVDPPERATSLPELLRRAQALPRGRANG
ncbi:MAG: serine/threonine protein kinase [Deltaproteobacteria bacterium]|nr:serine/threonine protein kinase [Deltaproteobacteria bacterium]MBK8715381.1 serine/threonine protein kinase [Deltaproteobacteria bacterium]MBP7287732.1 serine/threonine protein kinase [Nannocystaceae bacterium]